MKRITVLLWVFVSVIYAWADFSAQSPDGRIKLEVGMNDGKPFYRVTYDGQAMLADSPLGVVTNVGDFTHDLELSEVSQNDLHEQYQMRNIKQSQVNYEAREAVAQFNQKGRHSAGFI